ncbi:hypothetical protein M5689_024678 [Euphorbia peplus]|nr:hypothetical protein M5689_024678 [Euphorbia peplus]
MLNESFLDCLKELRRSVAEVRVSTIQKLDSSALKPKSATALLRSSLQSEVLPIVIRSLVNWKLASES